MRTDDHPANVAGAREFGWEAEFFVLQGTIADSVCRWARSRPDVG
ncbi:hypothetical protein OO014_05775 [Intrasporangium calvum]|uniref:Uncharacterized protein n=1 Tax=Intrasporangium calvum TaxID=53358 RepID=A0ABT5GF60_9MICO|nr:hypothetical protein [Intrasporangium calvum]MDC5696759.1 hypothetical protein [Intrasporangium calvum]